MSWLRTPAEAELPDDVVGLFEQPREKLGLVPNVLRLYALRPSHLVRWDAHYNELMKGESGLSKAEREMIAVVVSVANKCRYCISAHSAALQKLTGDPLSPTRSPPTTRRLRWSRGCGRCSTTPSS